MKLWALAGVVTLVLSVGAQQPPPAGRDPSWAFPVINQPLPAEEPAPKSVPGSAKSYTPAQIDDLLNPPDWFPDQHAPAPSIVQKGHGAALACGSCHLMSGLGHPESADVAGFTAAYIVQQMADFKSGARKDAARMNGIAKAMTDEESQQAAEWFAALKPQVWTRVSEAATVPKTIVGQGRMRFLAPGGGTEPIGNRIIELPQNEDAAEARNPRVGFIAHVPPGSIEKGKALAMTGGGGKTIMCTICHGPNLKGLGEVPPITNRSPIYIYRQLNDMQAGMRSGNAMALMKAVVEKLTSDDMIALSAYLGSLEP